MKRMTQAEVVARYRHVWDTPGSLRFSARCAYLDGRTAFAKELNRRAGLLAKARRTVGQPLADYERENADTLATLGFQPVTTGA